MAKGHGSRFVLRALLVPVVLCTAPGAGSAAAQVASPAVILPTREEIDPARRQPPPAPARLRVEGEIERSPCALADPAYATIKVTLTAATFHNLGPVAPADLDPAYRRYVGTEQPIAVICEIRDAAATILRRQGYVAAVQVPTQRIEGGDVGFEVLFARLTAVRVRGDAGRDERQLARYLERITTGAVFNRFATERYLLLARDMPGLDVRLLLKPAGTVPGDMIGEVSVRRTPVAVDVGVQDYAPVETGRWGGQLRAQFNGLTGLGDRTTIALYSTADVAEQQVLQVGHDFAIGAEGLRFGGRFIQAWSAPDTGDPAVTVHARSLIANIEASYPLVRSQALTVSGALGFDLIDQRVRFNPGVGLADRALSDDRLRVLYGRLDFDAVDMRGIGPAGTIGWHLGGLLEVRRGLAILNASPDCLAVPAACGPAVITPSQADGDPEATVLRFTGLAEWRFARLLTLALLPRAQVSSAPVFSIEQFSAGNYTIGRGYDPGTLAGDSGVGFQVELRHDQLAVDTRHRAGVQPYVFIDSDWVWNRGTPPGLGPRQLASTGAGARIGFADKARLDVTVAVPLRDAGRTRRGDVRLLVSLTTRLLPWGDR